MITENRNLMKILKKTARLKGYLSILFMPIKRPTYLIIAINLIATSLIFHPFSSRANCNEIPIGFTEKAITTCKGFFSDSTSEVIIKYVGDERQLIWDDYMMNARWSVLFKGNLSSTVLIWPRNETSVRAYDITFSLFFKKVSPQKWTYEQNNGNVIYITYLYSKEQNMYYYLITSDTE